MVTTINDHIFTLNLTVNAMSRKTMILFGMIIGSIVGGNLPSLLGIDSFSLTSLFGSLAGGLVGIWIAFKFTG